MSFENASTLTSLSHLSDTIAGVPTWSAVKDHIEKGTIFALSRHPSVQERRDWLCELIIRDHGSIEQFVWDVRLSGTLFVPTPDNVPRDVLAHFCLDENTPEECWRVLRNDWPYAMPSGVSHWLLWTTAPLVPPFLTEQSESGPDGICGFTGGTDGTGMEEHRGVRGGPHSVRISKFIKQEWPEDQWETAWFAPPHVLRERPFLSCVHVFVCSKDSDMVPSWEESTSHLVVKAGETGRSLGLDDYNQLAFGSQSTNFDEGMQVRR